MALVAEYGFVNTDLLRKYAEKNLKVPTIVPKKKPVKKSFMEELVELGKGAVLTTVQKWISKEKQKLQRSKINIPPEIYIRQKQEEERNKQIMKYMLIAGGIGAALLAVYMLRR